MDEETSVLVSIIIIQSNRLKLKGLNIRWLMAEHKETNMWSAAIPRVLSDTSMSEESETEESYTEASYTSVDQEWSVLDILAGILSKALFSSI